MWCLRETIEKCLKACFMCAKATLIIPVLTLLIVGRKLDAQIVLRPLGGVAAISSQPSVPSRRGAGKGSRAAAPAAPAAAPTATFSFGTVNALGLGTPANGITVSALSNGALYFFAVQVTINGLPNGDKADITGFISTNFTHSTAEVMENCPSNNNCNLAASYSAYSLNAASPSMVVPPPGVPNGTAATIGFGVFVPDNDGANAFTGNDTATVTLNATDTTTGLSAGTATVLFTPQTVQDAVQLTLSTAPAGLTVTAASDYSMNFGNVNGLGIGPAAGLTTVAVAGGMIYSTPYLLNPAYGDFTSTTGTIKVYVSTNFAHTTVLTMEDAAASGGPYNAISTNAGAQTAITTTAADRAAITRYLGMFVSRNTVAPFLGADNATLTYTLTVP